MTSSPVLDPWSYPLLLPHVGYHQDAVYFGTKRVAALSKGEGWFLDRCDGTRSLAEAVAGCNVSSGFIASIAHLLIWWPQPVPPKPSIEGRSVERLILTPCPEDAWLGIGGCIAADGGRATTLVQNVFQVFSGEQAGSFRTVRELSMACIDEAATAARLAAVAHGSFDIPERAARDSGRFPDDMVLEILRCRIAELLADRRPREVFVAASLDDDADASLLLEAVLALVGEGVLDADLHLYEDAPATLGERQVDDFLLRFEDSFLAPRTYYRDISDAAATKETILEVFRCRLDGPKRRAAHAAARRHAQDIGAMASAAERLWKIELEAWG